MWQTLALSWEEVLRICQYARETSAVPSKRFYNCVSKEDLKAMPKFLTQQTGSSLASWKVTFQGEGTSQRRFEHRKHELY